MNTCLCALACGLLVLLPACGAKKKEAAKPASTTSAQKVTTSSADQPIAPVATQPEVRPQEFNGLDQNEAQNYQNDKMEEDLRLALK